MATDMVRGGCHASHPKGCVTRDTWPSRPSRDSVTARDSRDSWDACSLVADRLRDLEITKKDRSPARAAQHFSHKPQGFRSGLHESWGRP